MEKNIQETALRSLARREHSARELTQKLKSKGFTTTDIDPLLENLRQTNLINDNRFTENYIYWRRQRGYGPLRIAMELQIRGISADIIAEHLQITDNAWSVGAQQVWRKRFKTNPLNNMKEKAKQQRFLQQRGFTREHINSIFEST